MEAGEKILVAAGLTAAVVVGAFVLWGPQGGAGGGARGRKRRGQVAGLLNLGRTCFLNTVLQGLAASPAFCSWLKNNVSPSKSSSMITTLSTVLEVINGTHENARNSGPVCPLGVLRCLGALGWVIPEDQHDAHELLHVILSCVDEEIQAMAKRQPGSLSDALGLLSEKRVETIDNDEYRSLPPLSLRSVSSPATPDSPLVKCARSLSQATIGLSDKTKALAKEINSSTYQINTPLYPGLSKGVSRSFCQLDRLGRPTPPPPPVPQAPFNGSMATRLQCTICSHKSPIRYDKFESISLHLCDNAGPFSIINLMRTFTAPEMLKGVTCVKCNEGRDSSLDPILSTHIKSISIGKLPNCLCLHIGRTQWNSSGLSKRNDHVLFQETLSLAPFSSSQPPRLDMPIPNVYTVSQSLPNSNIVSPLGRVNTITQNDPNEWRAMYKLQAVVIHVGGPRSGHFVTYRRGNGFEAKRWFYTSDSIVREVTIEEVLSSSAYMLFYEKYSGNLQAVGKMYNQKRM